MSEDLKTLDIKALAKKHTELAKKMLNLRFQQKMGQLDNTSEHKKTRRQIARILTEIKQKKEAKNA